jgi:hypothetical protein
VSSQEVGRVSNREEKRQRGGELGESKVYVDEEENRAKGQNSLIRD